MKIAILWWLLDPQLGYGGAMTGRILARGLAEAGHEVIAITTHGDHRLSIQREGRLKVYSFRPRNLYWVAEKHQKPLWLRALWQLLDIWNPHVYGVVRRILQQERPDVVHVGKLRGLSPSVWHAASSLGSVPIAQTCVDYELISPEGTLQGRLGQWAARGHWPLRPYQGLRARWSRRVDAVTAESQYTLDVILARAFFPLALKRVLFCSHGLSQAELDKVRGQELARGKAEAFGLRILYLGRLETIKGVNILCQAVVRIAQRTPGIHLDVVGGGSLESELRERYGTATGIHLHGPQFGPLKEQLLRACDVVVVPSVWPEVFGRVIIEAYAHGKPVVVSRAGGMPELVRERETGFVVPRDNLDALEETLAWLAVEPARARSLSNAALDAASQFSLENTVSAFVTLYRELVA